MPDLTSVSNSRVKDVVKLRNRRLRHDPKRFVIDGERLIGRAIDAGVVIDEIFRLETGQSEGYSEGQLEATSVSLDVMVKLSGRQNPPTAVAVARAWDLLASPAGPGEMWLALVAVEKPGNVGAVLRTASALGFTGVVLVDSAVDAFRPNVVRNAMGALFTMQVVAIERSELPGFAADRSAALVAAVSDGGSAPWDLDLSQAVIIAVGSESDGLPTELIAAADEQVTIPMSDDSLDSLNVAASAAIVMSEVVRQRNAGASQ